MVQQLPSRYTLVLRPWVSTVSGGDAYAHFDTLVMQDAERRSIRYGDYRVLGQGDDGRKTLRLDRFRFQCQIDGRRDESYAWQWGYQPANGSIFGPRDMELYGPSIAAINRGLDRSYREDGAAEGVGRFVVRLARVLKLDAIVLLETSQTGSSAMTWRSRGRSSPATMARPSGRSMPLWATCTVPVCRGWDGTPPDPFPPNPVHYREARHSAGLSHFWRVS